MKSGSYVEPMDVNKWKGRIDGIDIFENLLVNK